MPEFKLVSDFKPTGDQPQAIEKLVEGLGKGHRDQTLLGATGTGKSLGHDDPVFVVEKHGPDTAPHVVPIGELIDTLIEQRKAEVRQMGDTSILDVDTDAVQYFAQSLDPETCEVTLRPIRAFTRHTAPATMYRLQTACGRHATLTGDHNLWVLRDGRLQLIKTSEARTTDYMPVPEKLQANGHLESLDTLQWLSGERLFVEAPAPLIAYMETHGLKPLVQALGERGITQPHDKLLAVRQHRRGRGIEVDTFLHILERTDQLDGLWDPAKASVGGKRIANRLPACLKLTPAFLRLLGYYIAEGCHQVGYFIIANRHATIRQRIEEALNQLGIPFSTRPSSDYQVSSTALTELLKRLCGANARDKHLPEFWPQLSDEALKSLLSAYFDGDGSVGKSSDLEVTTASPRLASDLAYALMRFGIWARVHRKWKRATNADHVGDWYYSVTISGQADLRCFQQAIGFSVDYKQQALSSQLQHVEHSNVDVAPIQGQQLRWLRSHLGLFARQVAQPSGISRSAVSLFEGQQRAPRRATLLRLLSTLKDEAHQARVTSAEWWQVWNSLYNLCQVRWTPIASVEVVDYPYPFVYDLCVPGTETFLAGNGGFFIHNTFVMAKIIEAIQRPTLVIAHNKTLAAQLYSEFREFFPHNAVEYFVSYYDYYTPEAYVPQHDLYIEKDASINDEIDRLRLAATSALFSRRDVVIVSSVSCIYGLGSPEDYGKVVVTLRKGEVRRRDNILRHLVEIHYERNDMTLSRGKFRVRGDTLEIQPAYEELAYRIEFWGDEIERMVEIDPLTGEIIVEKSQLDIYPAKHFITPQERLTVAIKAIEDELAERLDALKAAGKLLEAQRLEQRTKFDLEMMREIGYCSGIENYSRHLAQREPGSPGWTLLDYFPDDFLTIIDESHMTVPQIHGMYNGDQSRKSVLVEYGFRLPSALDNRPLRFEEFEKRVYQVLYVSATPGPYELKKSDQVVEQIIRPTGLVDPEVIVRPVKGQVDDLIAEIRKRVSRHERVLVTTLTKKMAEDLADYLAELGIKVHYLHSEVQTFERVEILRDLRLGTYDVVVGINLLREGLDLPEVSLVAILDADKEGFLRSEGSLIQTMGRAARHVNGQVIMYADKLTDSMKRAIEETQRRRNKQTRYNKEHGIEPRSIVKAVHDLTERVKLVAEAKPEYGRGGVTPPVLADPPVLAEIPRDEAARMIKELEKQMKAAAQALEFEKAALLRDQIAELRKLIDGDMPEWERVRKQEKEFELAEARRKA